jgi:Ni/Co efflux regulator RcnB
MKTTHTLKQLALAAAIGTLAMAAPTAFAHDHGKGKGQGHAYGHDKASKDYRKAVNKAQKDQAKAYKRWAKGQHIPREYVVQQYYVNDYRDYGLAPPPPGYVWVQPYQQDDTYYMVQLASGLISQIFGR